LINKQTKNKEGFSNLLYSCPEEKEETEKKGRRKKNLV